MSFSEYFKIATIGKTKGLKGEMQLYIAFDGLEDIKFNAVFVDIAGKLVPYFVASYKPSLKNTAYIYLEDVDTVEKASALLKKEVYLPNKLKPKKKKQEFTLLDLKGFMAVDEQHGELGEITDVTEYPQQVIASLHYQNREVLFPLNMQFIKGIDVEGGEVYLDLPDGLLDVYLD